MQDTAVRGWRILLEEVLGAVQSTKVLGLEELDPQERLEQLEQHEQEGEPADINRSRSRGRGRRRVRCRRRERTWVKIN